MSEESNKPPDEQPRLEALPSLVNPPKPIGEPDASAPIAGEDSVARSPDSDPRRVNIQNDYLWQIHQYVNAYIRFSDQKGGVVIVVTVGLLAAMYGRSIHVPIVETAPGLWSAIAWLGCAAFFFLILALVFSGFSIRPRLTSSKKIGFIFWENIKAHGNTESFNQAFRRQSDSELTMHLTTHLYELAGICTSKYWWVSASIICVFLGGLLGALAMVL